MLIPSHEESAWPAISGHGASQEVIFLRKLQAYTIPVAALEG